MSALFPKLMLCLSVLTLSACVAGGSAKAPEGPNAITGDTIEVTALDGPSAKPATASAAEKVSARAPATTPATAKISASGAVSTSAQAAEVEPGPEPQPTETATPDPAKTPETVDPVAAAPEVPEAKKGEAQLACEKRGNIWATAGTSGAFACVKRLQDGGKRCTNSTQCKGDCLARSGTCAPVDPMFGCNDIFQDNGARVTQCLN